MDLVELASRAVPDLDKARYGTRVDSVHAGFNLPQPFHGEGVLVGVLDWGFDYTHPMFYDTALTTSRIRAVWDQYRQAGPPPSGYRYGTVAATRRGTSRVWAATRPTCTATPRMAHTWRASPQVAARASA